MLPRFLSSVALLYSLYLPVSYPYFIEISCKSHSPPWSQIGQSKGWLANKNSITPPLAILVRSLSVWTLIPGATCAAHAARGFGILDFNIILVNRY